jgi:hypothetical protein
MVFIVVAMFYEGNFHIIITITNCSHIFIILPTSTCVMVLVELPETLLGALFKFSSSTSPMRPKVTSPMTTSIRIPPYSKCSTILQTFFSDRT